LRQRGKNVLSEALPPHRFQKILLIARIILPAFLLGIRFGILPMAKKQRYSRNGVPRIVPA